MSPMSESSQPVAVARLRGILRTHNRVGIDTPDAAAYGVIESDGRYFVYHSSALLPGSRVVIDGPVEFAASERYARAIQTITGHENG